jgi:mono/diheme cytochrome c family protein
MRRIVRVVLGMLVVATTAGCDRKPDSAATTDFVPKEVPAEFAEGERLFNATCGGCHGERAVGTGHGPPLVHSYYEPNHHGDVAFQRAVTLGVVPHHWRFGPMPKINGVSDADVKAITAYVRWLQREAGIY